MIAIPWFFNMQDQMPLFATIFLVTNLLSAFWVPYSGTLVDKYDRKKVFLCILAISGLLIAAIAAWGQLEGGLPLLAVGAAFTITFLNYNIHYPTLYAFLQEITEKEYYGKLSSYIEVQGQFATITAGAFGAILLDGVSDGTLKIFGLDIPVGWSFEPWQIQDIFLLDAMTYLLAFLLVSLIAYKSLRERPEIIGTVAERFVQGYQYLKANPIIFIFGVSSYSVFVTLLLTGFYTMAPYVEHHLGESAEVYANMDMFYGLGAIIAGIAIRWIFRRARLIDSIIVLTFMMMSSFVVLFLTKNVLLFFILTFFQGICNAGVRVLRVGYLFKYVPNEVYGRTSSIFTLTNITFRVFFLAIFSFAFFSAPSHVGYVMLLMAIFLALTLVVISVFYRRFHKDLVQEI